MTSLWFLHTCGMDGFLVVWGGLFFSAAEYVPFLATILKTRICILKAYTI